MSHSTAAPARPQVQHVEENFHDKEAALQRMRSRQADGHRAFAQPNADNTWLVVWENLGDDIDDGPRFSLGDESAYPAADGWKEDYLLLESNHGTEKAEIVGTFFSSDAAIRCYSQAAWESTGLGGLRLQIIHRHRPVANGVYMTVTGEAYPMLVWILASGEVRKFVRRVDAAGETFAQLVW